MGTAGIKETKFDESGRTGHASNSIVSVITHLAICCINRFNNDFPGIRIKNPDGRFFSDSWDETFFNRKGTDTG